MANSLISAARRLSGRFLPSSTKRKSVVKSGPPSPTNGVNGTTNGTANGINGTNGTATAPSAAALAAATTATGTTPATANGDATKAAATTPPATESAPQLADDSESSALKRILAGNKTFIDRTNQTAPEFLPATGQGQWPEILWLGCSDSRVPETTICDCRPGDIFVHRNIANVIRADDRSANSVLDFSVGVVGVKHVIVCGHTKCGGAKASLVDDDVGENLNTWLAPVRDLRKKHQAELDAIVDDDERSTKLAELNVSLSIDAIMQNTTVKKAVAERGLTVHGLLYDVPKGELRVLENPTNDGL